MNSPDDRPLPDGYPDPEKARWVRTEQIEHCGLHIGMTVTPEHRIVQLWELEAGHPVHWLGNVFRVDAEPPCLYLNYRYDKQFNRSQQASLARIAAKFWKSPGPGPSIRRP